MYWRYYFTGVFLCGLFTVTACRMPQSVQNIIPINSDAVFFTPVPTPKATATHTILQTPLTSMANNSPLQETHLVENSAIVISSVPALFETPTMSPDTQNEAAMDNNMNEEKRQLAETLERLKAMTPGVDYIENQVYALVNSEDQAEEVAAQYGMGMVKYRSGVATYTTMQTVIEIMEIAATPGNGMYPVYPNFLKRVTVP